MFRTHIINQLEELINIFQLHKGNVEIDGTSYWSVFMPFEHSTSLQNEPNDKFMKNSNVKKTYL